MPTRSSNTHFFFTAFAHSAVGMALVGLHGNWLEVNPALCRILGYSRGELLGKTFQDITHPADVEGDLWLANKVLAGEIESYNLEKRYRHGDGHTVWGLLTVSLGRDDEGRPDCFIAQVIDITAQKNAVEDREAFFTLSPDLLAIANTQGYFLQVNPAWTEVLGWAPEELTSRPYSDLVHPDDVARTREAIEAARAAGISTGFRNRYRHAAGGYRWFEWSSRADGHGLLYCSVRDVTTQIENEERLRSQEEKIRLLIDNANDAFLAMTQDGIITEWNKQAETTFGWSAREAIGRPMVDLLPPERLRQGHLDGVARFLASGQEGATKRVEVPALRKDGQEILVEFTVGTMQHRGERYFHAFLRDVSEQRRMSEQMHYQATHDFLTRLPNRYEFMGRLQRAIEGVQRESDRPLVLLFIDLDGFKAVNDLCGHEAGDAVLIEFGQRLGHSVRRTDLVARLAGDEFVVMLDHVSNARIDADQVAQKILSAAAQPYAVVAGRTEVGASIGVAFHAEGDSADALLSRADIAMYMAKNAGKNRAAMFTDGQWLIRAASC
ncbi:PAS domain S-box protein [Massilia niastensis]|uniref:PAS domain S-box protein n=1 Tax=Massilia niastensis TaxID=544911 RepID=UPI00036D5B13|nr:PAS domain S-box protein [Massilia niastensis]